jgi:hypothetical protein
VWLNVITSPSLVRAGEDIFDRISLLVPQNLAGDMRDDLIQNIWMAVREGRLLPNDIVGRIDSYVRREYRDNHNAWGPRSLDAPTYVDSNTTLIETITHGLWD